MTSRRLRHSVRLPALLSTLALTALLQAPAMATGHAITVHHDPYCGCCTAWSDYLRKEGFQVTDIREPDMASIKETLGIPQELASCHTAVIQSTGQRIEGHAPASAIRKLLDRPGVKGIAVPGMPVNAPGMGPMDGTLVTLDLNGKPFSRD